jgi:YHS domain-containing protein
MMAKDPVCRIEVEEDLAAAEGRTVEFRDRTFYFCSNQCREKFVEDPVLFTTHYYSEWEVADDDRPAA